MRIETTVNADDVSVDWDDDGKEWTCEGCGRVLDFGDSHTVFECLQELQMQIVELREELRGAL